MKLLIILILNLIVITSFAQSIHGTFNDYPDFIKFENQYASFNIQSNGGLIVQMMGEGQFELIDHFLLVNTIDYSGEKSIVKTSKSHTDNIEFKIVDEQNNGIPYVNIGFLNKSNKIFTGITSNNQGLAFCKSTSEIGKISISCIGYDSLILDYDPTCNYYIKLAENEIIENQIVVFKTIKMDNESLQLVLLTTDFKPHKNKIRELKILDRRTTKFNDRIRTFKK